MSLVSILTLFLILSSVEAEFSQDPTAVVSSQENSTESTITEVSIFDQSNEEKLKGNEGKSFETTLSPDETTEVTLTIQENVDFSTTSIPNFSPVLATTSTSSKPFYHKTIEDLVKVVEANILGVGDATESQVSTSTSLPEEVNMTNPRLDRLSEQIRAIISHYQKYGEVTVPHADIPDPMDVPNVRRSFGGSPTTFTDMKMYGLSNFTIAHVNTDLNKMQVYVLVVMKQLTIIGNYSIRSWFTRASGPFNVTLLDVETSGAAELQKSENGILQATESEMDMTFRDAIVDFKNLGMVGSLLQGVLATAAPVLFEAIKPGVLSQINTQIREDLNAKLEKIGNRLAVSGSRPPLDAAEQEARAYLLENGYDPYRLKDFSIKQSVFTVNITEFVLKGLSNFQRVGEVVLAMDEGMIQIGIHVAALDLEGRCKWGIGIGKNFRRGGFTNFTIEHIQIRAFVNQSIDVNTKPKLDNLDINVGKIKLNMEGAGRFDIIVEVMVNSLPDLIRHILVDTIEEPLKYKIQQLLNKIEPHQILEKTLPELDNLGL
ncbi:uncharacterized protein isoform X1 [Rhodnius prolixus]|uniref:Hemolymph juvenile hormone binding protein n=2 Tax=Rhodnius prolixus TaxID=13249 RepID=A0ABL0DRC9_RHOPR